MKKPRKPRDPADFTRPAIVYMAIHKKTGAMYIGFTQQTLAQRAKLHVRHALNGWSHGVFAQAIRMHGGDAFRWAVVDKFDDSYAAIAEEQRIILVVQPECNSTKGGEAHKPLVHSAKVRARLSDLGKQNIDKWRMYSGMGPAASSKTVFCLNDGRSFPSASEAARAYGLKKSIVIEVCLRNPRRHRAAGLVFRYEGDHLDAAAQVLEANNKYKAGKRRAIQWACKAVICLTDGKMYPSAASAAAHYGISQTCVAEVCRNVPRRGKTRRRVKGLEFQYQSMGATP